MRAPSLARAFPVLLLLAAALAVSHPAAAQEGAITVSGRVLSDAGEPLAGVQVSGYTYQEDGARSALGSSDDTLTDDEGRYTLQLDAGKGWINVYYEKWRQSDGREISIDSARDGVDFTLTTPPPKTARIEGTVIGPDGQPIEGAEVSLQYACCYAMEASSEPVVASDTPAYDGENSSKGGVASTRPAIMPYPYYDDHASARTGSDGKFSFEAYAGPRQVVASAKGYAQTTVQVDAEDNATTTVEIALEKVPDRDAVLTGRVVDSLTGSPIANAQVNLRSLEWGRYAYATTGADGSFRIQTVPGWTEVSVSFWATYAEPMAADSAGIVAPRGLEQQYYPHTALVKLERGETSDDIRLDPKPKPTIALLGYVVDPDAKTGVSGAHVNVWNHETGDWGEATTDATGSFRVLVRAGHYTISAWKEGHLGGSQTFVVTSEPTQRHDMLLPKGTARWAPCDDTDCGGPIYYADGAKAGEGSAGASVASAPAPAPAPAPAERGLDAQDESASMTGASTERAATFSGSGGDLPPYDPADTTSIPAAQREKPVAEVAAPGALLAALALAGAAAVAMRRRR